MNLRQHKSREEPEINLVSLVDVVLLLLIFFMLTTSFVRQSELAVRLPQAASGSAGDPEQQPLLEITVSERGMFFVNGRALVDSRPQTLAAAIHQVLPETTGLRSVTISADGRAAHQDVVTAMDVVGRLGITEVRITTVHSRPE